MKNINKFSKLAILFTILTYLGCWFMSLDMYETLYLNSWISDARFLHLSIFGLPLIAFSIASVIFGILAVVKIYKKEGIERWIIIALTLFNISSLIYALSVWGSYL